MDGGAKIPAWSFVAFWPHLLRLSGAFTPRDRLNTVVTAAVSTAESHVPHFSCHGTEPIDCSMMQQKREMWYNKGCDAPFIISKWQSNPSTFRPIYRQISIYGLNEVSPPIRKCTRLEETKPDSGKINVHVWTVAPSWRFPFRTQLSFVASKESLSSVLSSTETDKLSLI